MKDIFVISDTHFFHDNILKYCKREGESTVEEMHENMIKEWNSVVKDGDIVIHLGDVAMKLGSKQEEIKDIVHRMNGTKVLVLGNHDRDAHFKNTYDHYWNYVGFKSICEQKLSIGDVIFSHEPMEIVPEGKINIHGHIHEDPLTYLYSLDRNRINVCVDAIKSYKPIKINDLLGIGDLYESI